MQLTNVTLWGNSTNTKNHVTTLICSESQRYIVKGNRSFSTFVFCARLWDNPGCQRSAWTLCEETSQIPTHPSCVSTDEAWIFNETVFSIFNSIQQKTTPPRAKVFWNAFWNAVSWIAKRETFHDSRFTLTATALFLHHTCYCTVTAPRLLLHHSLHPDRLKNT